ncbi:MAG: hypothetical protein M1834_002541 [Cirrosporium novae-zelandiae]|nr:MAG: hypothetical protein M1834_002541 [Cirrosporium novae-zelandiae]
MTDIVPISRSYLFPPPSSSLESSPPPDFELPIPYDIQFAPSSPQPSPSQAQGEETRPQTYQFRLFRNTRDQPLLVDISTPPPTPPQPQSRPTSYYLASPSSPRTKTQYASSALSGEQVLALKDSISWTTSLVMEEKRVRHLVPILVVPCSKEKRTAQTEVAPTVFKDLSFDSRSCSKKHCRKSKKRRNLIKSKLAETEAGEKEFQARKTQKNRLKKVRRKEKEKLKTKGTEPVKKEEK